MRILFDSKQLCYKDPFGTLVPGQSCRLNIRIPATVRAKNVTCNITQEDGHPEQTVNMKFLYRLGDYETFTGEFTLNRTGLYFYFFHVTNDSGSFRLFKSGDDTNMEAGDLWQVSCIPADFTTPEWA